MAGDKDSPSLSAAAFYSKLHPVLRERLGDLLEDLRDRGWNPRVPTLGGKKATGFRSLSAQAQAKGDGRSGVAFGFHTLRTPDGRPNAMAVHVTDPSQYGKDQALKKQFQVDLLAAAERFGMTTGLYWKAKNKQGKLVDKPDELHVQLGEQAWLRNPAQLAGLKQGIVPPLPSVQPPILQPRISRALAEGFHLKSIFQPQTPGFPAKPLWTPPRPPPAPIPITRPQFDSGRRMTLAQPVLGRDITRQPWNDVTRQPFRPVDRPFTKPAGFGDLTLKRPDVGRGFGNFAAGPMKLSLPTLGAGLGLGGQSNLNLGNFQLKLKDF